jgi:Ni/Fe-hydrogenase subunit HybB-like protein
MKLDKNTVAVLKQFAPQLESSSRFEKVMLILMTFMFLAGWPAIVLQYVEGHIITGMRDNVVWGVYIVNFIF